MSNSPLELLHITIKDTWRRRNIAILIYLCISLSVLAISWNWPKEYVSYSIVEVDEENILTPLLEGSAIATAIEDQARNAEHLIFSKRALDKVVEVLEIDTENMSDKDKEELWELLEDHASVNNIGVNLIQVAYQSKDPEMAQLLTSTLTNFFITESIDGKRRESEAAYKFIANQVDEYHLKLLESEEALKKFRSNNLGTDPGNYSLVTDRILDLNRYIEQSILDKNEVQTRIKNIDNQLTGEAAVSAFLTREVQLQDRIDVLQSNLDTLKMTYLDTYPDIIIIKDQIKSLKSSIKSLKKNDSKGIVQSGTHNPLFQDLRLKRSNATTELAALNIRIKETKELLRREKIRALQINNSVADYAQLTRDYDGNHTLYETLLGQRESARVSMNIDIANQGMTLKIIEKAELPISPIGIRYLHFAIFGLFGGLIAPLGFSFLVGNLDGSIKSITALKQLNGLPVLGSFGSYRNSQTNFSDGMWLLFASLIVLLVISLYGYIGWLKWTGIA